MMLTLEVAKNVLQMVTILILSVFDVVVDDVTGLGSIR